MTAEVFVPRNYVMDPAHETVIYGDQLQNGMIVLIEDSLRRGSPERINSDSILGGEHARDECLKENRWCMVTNLRFDALYEHNEFGEASRNGAIARFLGRYADDTILSRSYNTAYAWIVKIDSMPAAEGFEVPDTLENE